MMSGEWEVHNPFDEGDNVRGDELREMFEDRYRGRPDRIEKLKMSTMEDK